MHAPLDRRAFLIGTASAATLLGLHPLTAAAAARRRADAPPHFPHQDPELVQGVVGASHFDLDRVRELVHARPALARASWDWGFGDWETALGAASHTGRREIAEYLIANGARPNLFTLAMLGRLTAVRAVIEASPGIETIPGPHGITLLAHARAGREASASVRDYLERLGTADPAQSSEPLTAAERERFKGTFAYGPDPSDRIEIGENQELLSLSPVGGTARNLFHLGGGEFHPAGVPSVRIVFERVEETAVAFTIADADTRLRAERVRG